MAKLSVDLADPDQRETLPPRDQPYWKVLSYGRHLGLHRLPHQSYWVARARTRAGAYVRRRLGIATTGNGEAQSFEQALHAAKSWFGQPHIQNIVADARPIGVRQDLIICPWGGQFTIGHALHDYVEWKRVAAAKSHFETNLSLINHHLVPRLANVPANQFNGMMLLDFVKDVLATPPKRGNQQPAAKVRIEDMDPEALRKRKRTVNTLISILRVALRMAWENGRIESDRAWRCLRNLPSVDRPRLVHLSRPECRQLLAACPPDLYRLVLAALYTGCRSTELTRLRCSDVGRDGYGIYVAPLKRYRPRFVFLPDEAMNWFLELIKGRPPKDLVFVRDDGRPWYNNHRHPFKAIVRGLGLPDEFGFHGLRHTYASQLIQSGATIFAVAEQLGHSDPGTVLRTYEHLSPQIRESEVRQRFSVIVDENDRAARKNTTALTEWRSSLHGGQWRAYAQINDVAY